MGGIFESGTFSDKETDAIIQNLANGKTEREDEKGQNITITNMDLSERSR